MSAVMKERDQMVEQHQQTLIKMHALTDYFEQKERTLHKQLGKEELARREIEGREANVLEKVNLVDEEREKEKFVILLLFSCNC